MYFKDKDGKYKKSTVRIPIPPPGKTHTTKKGKKGYNRKKEKRSFKKYLEENNN